MYTWKFIQHCHGKNSIQQEEDSFHQQIRLKYKEENSTVLPLEHTLHIHIHIKTHQFMSAKQIIYCSKMFVVGCPKRHVVFSSGQEIFVYLQNSRLNPHPPSFLFNTYHLRFSYPWRRPGRENLHLLPLRIKVKRKYASISLPAFVVYTVITFPI